MIEYVKINIFLELAGKLPVFDVRSPIEFSQASIIGAVNFPLFSDEERAKVGTRYKQSGQNDATLLALDLIGPKLSDFIRKAAALSQSKDILMYCWRGGMRSASLAWLLNLAGYNVYVLEGGYKSFRKYIRNSFEQKAKIIILAGMTGSGKSEILNNIANNNEQVLDLEELANHKGSVLGSLGLSSQPSNEQFENLLFSKWNKFDLSKPVWIEDESFQIGYVNIPKPLFDQMSGAPAINIKIDKNIRIERLVNEYAHFDIDLIKECIIRLEKRIGGLNTKNIIEHLESKDFIFVASQLLEYYDKTYSFNLSKRKNIYDFDINFNIQNDDVLRIIKFAHSNLY